VTEPAFVLAPGVRVRVAPPVLPRIEVARPSATAPVLVPVVGPRGPKGDPGSSQDMEAIGELIDGAVTEHVTDYEPHPAYDDLPSLRLLFENGLI
jgi:hypothetical protein